MRLAPRNIFVAAVAGFTVLAGCEGPRQTSTAFEPGDAADPVVRLAQDALANAKTVQVTVTNPSNFALQQGLITFAPLFAVDQPASSAALNYVSGPSMGGATTFATSAGLTLGVDAFIVPAIAAGCSASIAITAPSSAKLSYIAHEAVTTSDFAASSTPMNEPNGSSGTFQTGFSVNSANIVTRGNATIGATPSIAVIAFSLSNASCGQSPMSRPLSLFSDDFVGGANSSAWPMNAGYDADFNGDWATDGLTARVWNPVGGDPAVANPRTTGFVKFLDICPSADATITLSASIDAAFTSANSDATMVLYYFSQSNALIRIDANHESGKGSVRRTTLFESPVPSNARRIAIAPMAVMASDEVNTLFFAKLRVTYAPKNTSQVTAIASDGLASRSSGSNQPTGWAEFGGDYSVMSSPNATWSVNVKKQLIK